MRTSDHRMILRVYDVDDSPARRPPSPGKCIYCRATGVALNEEHVILYAIGKNATILDGACCHACHKLIQRYEQEVLKKQLDVPPHYVCGEPEQARQRRGPLIAWAISLHISRFEGRLSDDDGRSVRLSARGCLVVGRLCRSRQADVAWMTWPLAMPDPSGMVGRGTTVGPGRPYLVRALAWW